MTSKDNTEKNFFLGFDLSTQQLKCIAINEQLSIVHTEIVQFDQDLPEYNTTNGVYIDGDRIASPVSMWLEALDLVLTKFKKSGFPLNQVRAISGSCHQHGSVYWSQDAEILLNGLNANQGSLVQQLGDRAFSRKNAPNWQDHSTGKQCQEMENIVGGSYEMSQITGSRAHLRFTGPQLLKIVEEEPNVYHDTSSITLISNFLSSLLCGELIPLDEADACGMNLYDIKQRKFHQRLIDLINDRSHDSSDDVVTKLLKDPVSCDKSKRLSIISQYFQDKYGFNTNCSIYPFTGDNLATICSLPLQKNDVLISLGTSTTVLLITDQYKPSPNYHLFIHPVIPNMYMAMICYSNGSLARETIKNELSDCKDWSDFNNALDDTNIDTSNELGLYFPLGEIVPSLPSDTIRRVEFDRETGNIMRHVDNFDNVKHDVKNIVESQALSCRVRISKLLNHQQDSAKKPRSKKDILVSFDSDKDVPLSEYQDKRPNRVFFVGGASQNESIVKKFSQILDARNGNYRLNIPNSCALGGCFKAIWSEMANTNDKTANFADFMAEHWKQDELQEIPKTNPVAWSELSSKIVAMSHLEQELLGLEHCPSKQN